MFPAIPRGPVAFGANSGAKKSGVATNVMLLATTQRNGTGKDIKIEDPCATSDRAAPCREALSGA